MLRFFLHYFVRFRIPAMHPMLHTILPSGVIENIKACDRSSILVPTFFVLGPCRITWQPLRVVVSIWMYQPFETQQRGFRVKVLAETRTRVEGSIELVLIVCTGA